MDFSWFATIPGMLITGGVLLLIISLVMFIAMSNKKDKTKGKASKKSEEGAKNIVNEMEQNMSVPVNNSPIDSNVVSPTAMANGLNVPDVSVNPANQVANEMGGVSPIPVGDSAGVAMPVSESPAPNFDVPVASVQESSVPPVSDYVNSPMTGVVNDIPVSGTNDVSTGPSVFDNVTSVASVPATPEVATTPVGNSIPVIEASPISSVQNSVPSVDNTPMVANNFDTVPVNSNVVNDSQIGTTGVETAPTTTTVNDFTIPVTTESSMSSVPPVVNNDTISPMSQGQVTSTVAPVVNVNPQPSVPIYGGASPVVSGANLGQESHQIYGGANPLDNTQNISIADINQAAAAAMAHNAANATPTVASVPNVEPAPVVDVVPVAPVENVAPVQPVTPVQSATTVTPEVVAAPSVVAAPNQGQ